MVSFELSSLKKKYHSKTNKIKGNDAMKIGHFLSSSIELNRTPGLFHAWLRPKKLMFYKNVTSLYKEKIIVHLHFGIEL